MQPTTMSSMPLKIDPTCIMKQGYLIKSPPMREATIIRKRWRMRWFVLYDTQPLADIDPAVEREVQLIYYKNDKSVVEGSAIGQIPLVGCEVYKHKGRLHGYSHIINVQTEDRLYHLCATQIFVLNEWLEQIREHHVPYMAPVYEIPRCPSSISCGNHNYKTRSASISLQKKTRTIASNSSELSVNNCGSSSDEDYDHVYANRPSFSQSKPSLPTRVQSCIVRPNERIPSLYENPSPTGVEETPYIGMNSFKATIQVSEDEGIGRTDSESSTTSSNTAISTTITTFTSNEWTSKRDLLLGDFVGPRLSSSSSNKNRRPVCRTMSLGDITLLPRSPLLQRLNQQSFEADI